MAICTPSPRPGANGGFLLLITSVWRLLGVPTMAVGWENGNKSIQMGEEEGKRVCVADRNDQAQPKQQWTAILTCPERNPAEALEPESSLAWVGQHGTGKWWGSCRTATRFYSLPDSPLGRPEGHQMKKSYQDWPTQTLSDGQVVNRPLETRHDVLGFVLKSQQLHPELQQGVSGPILGWEGGDRGKLEPDAVLWEHCPVGAVFLFSIVL